MGTHRNEGVRTRHQKEGLQLHASISKHGRSHTKAQAGGTVTLKGGERTYCLASASRLSGRIGTRLFYLVGFTKSKRPRVGLGPSEGRREEGKQAGAPRQRESRQERERERDGVSNLIQS